MYTKTDDFLKLVLVAFVIAVPVSWYAANTWLESFVYHIPIQWWVFVMAGLVILAAQVALDKTWKFFLELFYIRTFL